jgi:hypothetical protein
MTVGDRGPAGTYGASMIDTVFAFFALAWVPWALSAALVLGALALWLRFRLRLRPINEGLDAALAVIREASAPIAFRDRFPSLDQQLAANPIIGDAWRAFAQTLVSVPGQEGALGATRRPADDFNEAVLGHAGVNLRFYMAVPNYLVGLGLLFTFLGLVAALYFASAGVAAGSVQGAQGALRDLLAAATFKFVTSIAGLGTSIVYSWREKTQLYRVARRLGQLCTALEQRLVPVTPEYLGVIQLDELNSQTALLRRLGRHLHVTIPETIEERLAAELIESIQPLREGFANAAARLARLDEQLADRLAGAPPKAAVAISGTRGVEADGALAGLLEELRRLRETIEGLPAMLPAPPPPWTSADAELGRALPGFVELFETSIAGIDALDSRLELSLSRIGTALNQLRPIAVVGSDAQAEAARSHLGAGIHDLADMRRELGELGRMFREVAADSRAVLAAHHAHAEGRDPELLLALDQLSRNVQRFNERVRSFIGRVDEELARSSKLFSGVVGGIDQRSR